MIWAWLTMDDVQRFLVVILKEIMVNHQILGLANPFMINPALPTLRKQRRSWRFPAAFIILLGIWNNFIYFGENHDQLHCEKEQLRFLKCGVDAGSLPWSWNINQVGASFLGCHHTKMFVGISFHKLYIMSKRTRVILYIYMKEGIFPDRLTYFYSTKKNAFRNIYIYVCQPGVDI